MKLRKIRLLLWALVVLATVGGIAVLLTRPETISPAPERVKVGAPFALTASDGTQYSSDRLAGRPYAMFFGFTHCPDVCPTTLARLAKLRKQVGKGNGAFDIVFVTVDPERDTPKEMARYVEMFATPVVALTGTTNQIDAVRRNFGIFSEKVSDNNGGYSVDHSAQILLFNRDGSFGGTIAFDEADPVALQKLVNISES